MNNITFCYYKRGESARGRLWNWILLKILYVGSPVLYFMADGATLIK